MREYAAYRNIEFSRPDMIRGVQKKLLHSHLEYLKEHSPYYRRMLHGAGIDISLVTLDNFHDLPLTDKSDIARCNDDFLSVPMSNIVDIVLSSGTTGEPVKVFYTENDLRRLAYNEEISFTGCGMTADDVVLLTCTMDRCFVAGLAYFLGIRSLGAAAIRNGLSNFESHLAIIKSMQPTVLVGVPTFLRKLGLFLESQGMDPYKTSVNKLVCIGETIRDETFSLLKVGKDLEEIWGAKVFSTYASSESITTFCECTERQGGHLHPELMIAEIVNDRGEVLPAGEIGEVVVTPLSVEGMPLLRFRTGDMSFLADEPCHCGRFSPRLGPILGRKQQMIKYRGTTLYPQAIYAVLDEIPGISEYYISVAHGTDLSDDVKVYVSVRGGSSPYEIITEKLQARLRVKPEIIIAGEESVRKQVYSGNSRKLLRFIDRRDNK
jgi:phenylacetate-CoA ligase